MIWIFTYDFEKKRKPKNFIWTVSIVYCCKGSHPSIARLERIGMKAKNKAECVFPITSCKRIYNILVVFASNFHLLHVIMHFCFIERYHRIEADNSDWVWNVDGFRISLLSNEQLIFVNEIFIKIHFNQNFY